MNRLLFKQPNIERKIITQKGNILEGALNNKQPQTNKYETAWHYTLQTLDIRNTIQTNHR